MLSFTASRKSEGLTRKVSHGSDGRNRLPTIRPSIMHKAARASVLARFVFSPRAEMSNARLRLVRPIDCCSSETVMRFTDR